ncbi:hypothetical protein ACFX2H_010675 [Malus domestica]
MKVCPVHAALSLMYIATVLLNESCINKFLELCLRGMGSLEDFPLVTASFGIFGAGAGGEDDGVGGNGIGRDGTTSPSYTIVHRIMA